MYVDGVKDGTIYLLCAVIDLLALYLIFIHILTYLQEAIVRRLAGIVS